MTFFVCNSIKLLHDEFETALELIIIRIELLNVLGILAVWLGWVLKLKITLLSLLFFNWMRPLDKRLIYALLARSVAFSKRTGGLSSILLILVDCCYTLTCVSILNLNNIFNWYWFRVNLHWLHCYPQGGYGSNHRCLIVYLRSKAERTIYAHSEPVFVLSNLLQFKLFDPYLSSQFLSSAFFEKFLFRYWRLLSAEIKWRMWSKWRMVRKCGVLFTNWMLIGGMWT